MRNERIACLPAAKRAYPSGSRSGWSFLPLKPPLRPAEELARLPNCHEVEPDAPLHACGGGYNAADELTKKEDTASSVGHALFQEIFFFCTVKNMGDVPGPGCIYVETVVDRDSGFSFAKVYSAKNPMNAVDILASRALPFFQRNGIEIKEIHTQKTNEYCGLVPVHPFETFLATSHIQHLPINVPGQPYNYLCEQFYRFLLHKFFPAALRKTFRLSIDDLQKDLDTFVEAYNATQMKSLGEMKSGLPFPSKFPVDL